MTDQPIPFTSPTLAELLADLKIARQDSTESRAAMLKRMEQLQKDPEYDFQSNKYTQAIKLVEDLESQIKSRATAMFMSGGINKNPIDGVKGVEHKTFAFEDEAKIREWSLANYPAALLVDPKNEEVRKLIIAQLPSTLIIDEGQIKTYAAKIGAVPGVFQGTEVRFQIASKLP